MTEAPAAPPGGYIVRVATPRMGGAFPVLEDYIVHEPDRERARQIIQATLSPDDSIESVRPLPPARIPADLPAGAYRPWF